MKKERVWYLDFIRAIAVIMIILHHFNAALIEKGIMVDNKNHIFILEWKNGNFGTLGVSLFFIISGAALMLTYKDDYSLKKYVIRRVNSIFPLFYIAYFVAFIFLFWMYKGIHFISAPKWTILLTIIGMDGYFSYLGPTWYLVGEWFLGCIIFMYCLFPLLKKLLDRWEAPTIIVSFILYILCVIFNPFQISITRNILIRGLDMLLGMVFMKEVQRIKPVFGILSIILMILLFFYKIPFFDMFGISMMGWCVFVSCAFIAQYINFDFIKKLCSKISKYSYGIFLTHHLTILYIAQEFRNKQLSFLEGLTLLLLIVFVISIVTKGIYVIYNFVCSLFKR